MNFAKNIAYALLLSTIAVTAACGSGGNNADTNDLIEKIDLLQKKITELESTEATSPAAEPAADEPVMQMNDNPTIQIPMTLGTLHGKWKAKSWVLTDGTETMDLVKNGYAFSMEIGADGNHTSTVADPAGKTETQELKLFLLENERIRLNDFGVDETCGVSLSPASMTWNCQLDEQTDIVWERAE